MQLLHFGSSTTLKRYYEYNSTEIKRNRNHSHEEVMQLKLCKWHYIHCLDAPVLYFE